MSTQPIPIDKKQEEIRKRERADLRSDLLYVAGSLLVTAGASTVGVRPGLISAGVFCLLIPVLELAGSFIRGIRIPVRK